MSQNVVSVRSCLSPARARVTIDAPLGPAMYGRMFPELPSYPADEQFLRALGRAGGVCDCGDVDDTPDTLGDSEAGWPVFGQFVAHDITADRSMLRSHANTAELRNARSPQLNLECLYGDGPTGNPFLYQRDDPAKFLLGSDDADVQRNAEGIAIIGDPRNDSHMLMSQLHLAMLKAHNAFVERSAAQWRSGRPRVRRSSAPVALASSMGRAERVSPRARRTSPCRRGASRGPAVVSSCTWRIYPAGVRRRRLSLRAFADSPPIPIEFARRIPCRSFLICWASARCRVSTRWTGRSSSTHPVGRPAAAS